MRGKCAHFISRFVRSRVQLERNRTVRMWRWSQVERLKNWHHNYSDVQNRLPGSCLVRLGMRDQSDEHRDCECCRLDCPRGFPVLARHTALVGCNQCAKPSVVEVSHWFSRAYVKSAAPNLSRCTVQFLESVRDLDKREAEPPFLLINISKPDEAVLPRVVSTISLLHHLILE